MLALSILLSLVLTSQAQEEVTATQSASEAIPVGVPRWSRELVIEGSLLEVRPPSLETALILRIDSASPHGTAWRYDFEYYGLEPGSYDLVQFLRREDGSEITELEPITVIVESGLPPGQVLPHKIQAGETPELGGYTELLWTLGGFWLLGSALWFLSSRRSDGEDADLKVSAQGLKSTTPEAVLLAKATADFSQGGWAIAGSIDADPASGWGIHPQRDMPHQAVFALAEPLETPGGAHLLITMSQPFGTKHVVGHFRFSVTSGEGDIRYVDMDDSVLAALAKPQAERTIEAREDLHSRFMKTVPEFSKTIRMAAARDIAWALINSPAFLYNR